MNKCHVTQRIKTLKNVTDARGVAVRLALAQISANGCHAENFAQFSGSRIKKAPRGTTDGA
jgi:hypothetical protein